MFEKFKLFFSRIFAPHGRRIVRTGGSLIVRAGAREANRQDGRERKIVRADILGRYFGQVVFLAQKLRRQKYSVGGASDVLSAFIFLAM